MNEPIPAIVSTRANHHGHLSCSFAPLNNPSISPLIALNYTFDKSFCARADNTLTSSSVSFLGCVKIRE
ncbi:hypothetical protein [Mycoplasmopsis glycophila]|uniref:hypothetical protein n=1 Tax=Mycoplasmopsis glycophila TaxID=171285 RepID=UPI00047F64C6|nr:hypothetical protein [Mycoplasmopsis glycophila]